MNHANKAKNTFERLLKKFEELKNKDTVTQLDIARLCTLCRNFEDAFATWEEQAKKFGENNLKSLSIYDEYVKSTPINELLQVAYGKRFKYIAKYFAENKDNQTLCVHSNIKSTCLLCLRLKIQNKK